MIDTDTVTAGSELQISSSLTNSTRFNYSVQHGATSSATDNFGGAVPIPINQFLPPPFSAIAGFAEFLPFQVQQAGFSAGNDGDNHSRQININDSVTKSIGAHQLKFGAEFRQLRLEQTGFNPGLFFTAFLISGPSPRRGAQISSLTRRIFPPA